MRVCTNGGELGLDRCGGDPKNIAFVFQLQCREGCVQDLILSALPAGVLFMDEMFDVHSLLGLVCTVARWPHLFAIIVTMKHWCVVMGG